MFFVFVLCHAAYVATCQQISVQSVISRPSFVCSIVPELRHWGAFVPAVNIFSLNAQGNPGAAPGNETDAEIKAAATDFPDIKDPVSVAVETDSAEVRDFNSIAFVNTGTVQITEPPMPPGPSMPGAVFEEAADPVIGKYADMISVDVQEINNYPLYRFIDEWYGTRYRWGGEDNDGIDCSAFSKRLYDKVYGAEINRTSRQQYKHCERVKNAGDAEEGDLIFFRIHRWRVSHVGVYLANGFFVHASRSQGVVISSLDNKYWRKRYAGCGRVERTEKATYESDASQ